VKGRLTSEQLDAFGKEADARMRVVRQPDAARGHVANFWYEVALKDSKRDELRRVLFARNIRRKIEAHRHRPLNIRRVAARALPDLNERKSSNYGGFDRATKKQK